MNIETIDFNKPAKRRPRTETERLFREQKRIRNQDICMHRKYEIVMIVDRYSDQAINIVKCSFCGIDMTPEQIKSADDAKEKFSKLGRHITLNIQ